MSYKRERLKRNKQEYSSDNSNTSDFLKAAISDLTGNLTLLDTKISLIMATVGVVLGLVVACKSNVLKAYHFYEDICIFKAIFLLLSVAYIVSVIITFVYGIKCVMIRFGKSKSSSLWFFQTEDYGGITEQNYLQKVKHMTDESITKNLAVEVYKLNRINNRKMRTGKITIIMFAISCAIISALMIMVGISYLVVQ